MAEQEKTLKVSIDGSKAQEGAAQVVGAIDSIKSSSQGAEGFVSKLVSLFQTAWGATGPKTATDSLSELSQASRDSATNLDLTRSALSQAWNNGGPSSASQALKDLSAEAGNSVDKIKTTQAALLQSWGASGPAGASSAIKDLSTAASQAVTSIGAAVRQVGSAWSTGGITGAVAAVRNLVVTGGQAAASVASASASVATGWATSAINGATSAVASLTSGANAATVATKNLSGAGASIASGFASVGNVFRSINAQIDSFTSASGAVRQVLSTLIPLDLIAQGARAFFDVTNRLQGFLSTMSVVTGSVSASKTELQNLFDIANKYGVNVVDLTNQFAKLAAAAKGTTLEGERIRTVFESIVAATSAMHLSTDDTRLVLYALQQMVSKGTVSFEELRRQMAERFPGAMRIAAESMGMTDTAFQKLVKSGKLFTEDFLPGFAAAIKEKFAAATEISTNSLLAATNRLSNAWEAMLLKLAQSSLTQSAARAMDKLTESVNKISPETITAVGDSIGHLVDYFSNFVANLDQSKIDSFVQGIGTAIHMAGDALGLLFEMMQKMAPIAEKTLGTIRAWFTVLTDGNLSLMQKFSVLSQENANQNAINLGMPERNDISAYVEEQHKINDLKVAWDEAHKSEGVYMTTLTEFGTYTFQADKDSEVFFNNQKARWDQWGDQVSRKIQNVRDNLKFVDPDPNSGSRIQNEDHYDRYQRVTVPKMAGINFDQQSADDKTKLKDLQDQYALSVKNIEIRLKENDIAARYNKVLNERKAAEAELKDSSTTDERRGMLLKVLIGDEAEYIAAKKAYNSQLKANTKEEDNYTNVLGRFTSAQKASEQDIQNIMDGYKGILPVQREYFKLLETAQYAKYSQARKDELKDQFDLAEAAAKRDEAVKDLTGTLDKLTEADDKADVALKQEIENLENDQKANKDSATAQLERVLALQKTKDELARLDPAEKAFVQGLIDKAKATAAAKDADQQYYDGLKKFQDASDKTVKSLDDETKKLLEKTEGLALTKEQQDKNLVSMRELQLAEVEHKLTLERLGDANTIYIDGLEKQRDALKANIDALKGAAYAENTKAFQDAWVKAVDFVGDRFAKFIDDVRGGGWSAGFKNLWKDFEDFGIKALAKFATQKIAISIFPELETAFGQGNNGPLGLLGTILGISRPVPPPKIDVVPLQASVVEASVHLKSFSDAVAAASSKVSPATDTFVTKLDQDAQNLADFGESTSSAKNKLQDLANSAPNFSGAQSAADSFANSLSTTSAQFSTATDGVATSTANLVSSLDSAGTGTKSLADYATSAGPYIGELGNSSNIAAADVSQLAAASASAAGTVGKSSEGFNNLYGDLSDFSGSVGDASTGLDTVSSASDTLSKGFGSVVGSMGGFISGVARFLGLAGGSGGGAGGALGAAQSGGNLLSSVSSIFGGGGGLLSSIGGLIGGGFGSALGAGFTAGISTLTIASEAGVAAIGGVATAMGAMAAVAIPVVGWIAAIGIALWAAFGKKGGGPKTGGFAEAGEGVSVGGDNNRYFTPNQSDADLKKAADQVLASYNGILKSLGGTGSAGFALGYDSDPKGTADNRVSSGAFVGGKQVYGTHDIGVGRDADQLQAALALEGKRVVLAALQASDLPAYLSKILTSVKVETASSDAIDQIIAEAAALKGAVDVMGQLGDQFNKLDPDQIKGLLDSFGGIDAFTKAFQYLNDNFLSTADKKATETQNLTDAFKALGIEVPKSHKDFLDLLNGLDLTDASQQQLYVSLTNLAPAFIDVYGTAEQAAQALEQQAAANQKLIDSATEFFNQNFFSQQEQDAQRLSGDWGKVHDGWTQLGEQLLALGIDHIPTTNAAFRALVESIDTSTASGQALHDALILLAPAIFDLNKTSTDAADAISNAADEISRHISDLNDAASQAQSQFSSMLSAIDDISKSNSGGDLGNELTTKLSLLREQSSKYTQLLSDQLAGPDPYGPLANAYRAMLAQLATLQSTATDQLARFTVLKAQYGATIAGQLVDLEDWYKGQQQLFQGNSDALAALKVDFDKKWQDIINGVAGGVDGAIDQLSKLRQAILDYIKSLKGSDLSPLTPKQKLDQAQAAYLDELKKAQSGDLTALGDITKYSDEYLKLARDYYASSPDYTAIFNLIIDQLSALGAGGSHPPPTVTPGPWTGGPGAGINPPPPGSALDEAVPVNSKLASQRDIQDLGGEIVQAIGAAATMTSTGPVQKQLDKIARNIEVQVRK